MGSDWCGGVVSAVGALSVCHLTIKFALWFLRAVRAYVLSTREDLKKYGSWAVVTGSTDGIGKAYAEQLAAQGINIVLISRSQEKLDNVAKEIEGTFSVKTQTIAIDFTCGSEIYDVIRSQLSGLDIGILVNNVGMSLSYPEYFLEVPNRDKVYVDMININITSCTMMTSVVLPGMVEKKKGLVINVASLAGIAPCPLLSVYSAAKSYVIFLSSALRQEYASKGIVVQCTAPGMVATKMSKIRKTSWMIPGPTTFVKSALATVHKLNLSFGVLSHAIQAALAGVLPQSFQEKYIMDMHLAVRKKALNRIKSKVN